MKLAVNDNQLIIKKFISSVKLSASDIELIEISEIKTTIKAKSGKTYVLDRLTNLRSEAALIDFAYRNKTNYEYRQGNENDVIFYSESELDDRFLEMLEKIRVSSLPKLKAKFGSEYDLLMVPSRIGPDRTIALGAVKNDQPVRFKTEYTDDGMLDDCITILMLARITAYNGECIYRASFMLEDDDELDECMSDIINDAELE